MDAKSAKLWLHRYYDKLVSGIVLFVLLISAIYLGVQLGSMQKTRNDQQNQIKNTPIAHPDLSEVVMTPYDQALAQLKAPAQVDAVSWAHPLFVPAERIFCPACGKPSLSTGETCSLCGAPLPKGASGTQDSDGDLMPDLWEQKYSLDPKSEKDAALDLDGDGFSNLQEYQGQSDPGDKLSLPDLDLFLVLKELKPNKFNLIFRGKVTLQGGETQYQLNLKSGARTYLVKMGGSIDGFKLINYQEKIQTNGQKRADLSVLKLQRGDRIIPLTRNHPQDHEDFTAVLGSALDPVWGFTGAKGAAFDLSWKGRTEKYKIKEIDSANRIVVIDRVRDRKEIEVRSAPGLQSVVDEGKTPVLGGAHN